MKPRGPAPILEQRHARIQSEGRGLISNNTGSDPLTNRKAIEPAFNAGPSSAYQRNAIEWRFADVPMIARL